jgi:hypothetical protein
VVGHQWRHGPRLSHLRAIAGFYSTLFNTLNTGAANPEVLRDEKSRILDLPGIAARTGSAWAG